MSSPPLILDFDASVLPLDCGETRIPLSDWQEDIRFGCSWRRFAALEAHLAPLLPKRYGCVLTGSGDFHHLSLLLLRETARRAPEPFDLVVCDNHPDNMRYAFGLHCGSWISHAAALPCVRQVHVLGICSPDITWRHAWENRLSPLLRRKLVYWSVNKRANWLSLIRRAECCRSFLSANALIEAFVPLAETFSRVYFSLDKDVLSPALARTNWDQGIFEEGHIAALMGAVVGKLVGFDLCGDPSEYVYKSRLKRLMRRLDGQQEPGREAILDWQKRHRDINRSLACSAFR